MEFEAAGDLVTAGLVAHEVEGAAGAAGEQAPAAPCANCGTPVSGHYCGHCGQKAHLHKSVLHLAEELIHGVLHFDTKGWRTMPLLVRRPGQLTRRYIDGQRTRFVSPLALFLFMMFFMFFVFSLTVSQVDAVDGDGKPVKRLSAQEKHTQAREDLAEAEQRLAEAAAGTREQERAQRALEKVRTRLGKAEKALQAAGDGAAEKESDLVSEVMREAGVQKNAGSDNYSNVGWIDRGIKHAVDNPELAKYKLKNAAYKYSFLLVPISLPFLWLMFFWRPGVTMYDHAVFSLYSLSFMSLLLVVVAVLGYFDFGGWAASLFVFVPPVHMYLQLRDTYSLTRFGAIWRTCTLLFMTLVVLTMYALVVLALAA